MSYDRLFFEGLAHALRDLKGMVDCDEHRPVEMNMKHQVLVGRSIDHVTELLDSVLSDDPKKRDKWME